jgi:glycosyltransferase involved in cell wall biosynthesis
MIILHVTEAMGGGVEASIGDYMRNAPFAEHHLLATVRTEDQIGASVSDLAASVENLPRGVTAAVVAIRSAYRRLHPDFVHLHSSFAGMFGRICLLPRHKIIYTPHCFGFERLDVSPIHRALFRMGEEVLSFGCGTVAGVSPRECDLARRMFATMRVHSIPNVGCVPKALCGNQPRALPCGTIRVAMVGRLTPQKDPGFFMETARALGDHIERFDLRWLGGGDDTLTHALENVGVSVSGWLQRNDLLMELVGCDAYFHCAAWEGAPISLLEAAGLGLPIVVRDIPAIRSLGLEGPASPSEAAAELMTLTTEVGWRRANDRSHLLKSNHTHQAQQQALAQLYQEC